ncbi:MAG: Acyl carrier protein [Pseudomonadota bacterium]|jgi:acyl carrier protein
MADIKTDDVESRVINVTAQVLKVDPSKVTLDASFTNDLGADSLDTVEMMMAIEAEFGCDIPDEDAGKIATVRDAVDYVKNRISSKA